MFMHTEQLKDVHDELDAIRNAKDVAVKDLEKARLKVYMYVHDSPVPCMHAKNQKL